MEIVQLSYDSYTLEGLSDISESYNREREPSSVVEIECPNVLA